MAEVSIKALQPQVLAKWAWAGWVEGGGRFPYARLFYNVQTIWLLQLKVYQDATMTVGSAGGVEGERTPWALESFGGLGSVCAHTHTPALEGGPDKGSEGF